MVWRGVTIDPGTDSAAPAVIEAFEKAQRAGLPSVDCYRAAVAAWRQAHPDHTAEYASKQAVAITLASRASLRIED